MKRRLLVKISGESLSTRVQENESFGIHASGIEHVVGLIQPLQQAGHTLGLVLGGGNFIRGQECAFIDRVIADQMGMLATVINALAISAALHHHGIDNAVMTPSKMPNTLEWDYNEALIRLDKGQILLFAGGTGNPFFSTDSAAALRGIQIKADVLIKATKHGGIYDVDPAHHANAKLLPYLSFEEVLKKRLQVMDMTAFELCYQHRLPICVFKMDSAADLLHIAEGRQQEHQIGSLVS